MTADLTRHESFVVDDIVSVIDYAGRVLLSADPGSHYQQDKAQSLARAAAALAERLEKGYVPTSRALVLEAAIAREARRYALGRLLFGKE